jgi:hypothetical protein
MLSISVRTLDEWRAAGMLKTRQIDGRKMIERAELVRFASHDQFSRHKA